MPEEKVRFDITQLENFGYDASRCVHCKGCKWVDHIYLESVEFSRKCPSEQRYLFDSFAAYGRLKLALAILDKKLDYSDRLLDAIYACPLCGACDVGCKRNLDLEILLTLEALRVRCVREGIGPPVAYKKMAENISLTHNSLGASPSKRLEWFPQGVEPAEKADIVYFVGCSTAFEHPEIARATVKILDTAGVQFALLGADEWCCGNRLFSAGMIDEAKELAEHNMEAIRERGAKTVLTSCAECYRMLKVDYPKMFGKSTKDMDFQVVHLVELVDDLLKREAIKLSNRVDLKVTYHDSCSLGRLSEPWLHYEGTRGHWGVLSPKIDRRRGTYGIYQQPRDILNNIPGMSLVEMARMRENAWCCGAGRGTKAAYEDFALWSAQERLKEVRAVGAEALVSACPWCKSNFAVAAKTDGLKVKVLDIAELISEAISRG